MDNEDEKHDCLKSRNVNKGDIYEDGNAVENKQTWACAWFMKFKTDKHYSRKLLKTVLLFWTFAGLGWMTGQIGPSFPDLQLVVEQTLDTASWLFTIYSFGYMAGSFAGGLLYDHFSKSLVIAFSTMIMAVTTVALPWCRWFALMLAVRFLSGVGAGGLDTGANAYVMSFWGEKARSYIQGLHFCFSFGGIISPLTTEPFLAKRLCQRLNDKNESDAESSPNSTWTTHVPKDYVENDCKEPGYGPTYVHFAYLISFFVILSTSVPFFVIFVKEIMRTYKSPNIAEVNITEQQEQKGEEQPRTMNKFSKKVQTLILILLSLFMMIYCAVEDTFSSFLATFCISYFGWGKDISSYATSVFWFAFAVGRFLAIFIVKRFKPVNLLMIYCISLIIAFLGILTACFTSTTSLLWVSISLAGFSMSLIFPSVYSWTEESILQVTGKISSLFVIAGSIGLIINPIVLGYLMDNMTPMWFVYLLLGKSCFTLLLIFVVIALVKLCKKSDCCKNSGNAVEKEMVPLQSNISN
ncbi:sodium-dependent glucose transporter 1A-like isoform X1 [Mercenaria mercenaria]|uniref:sodium-dependent glucose transporter 1A-like isoform X1 n=1 Tax=Mercenaria mercenaria TaxID=6596 RepID=UPI00234E8994|nr:sodium-dependent glucose transporter 1A-like isoform X1 [Mercenaria mercenaria]